MLSAGSADQDICARSLVGFFIFGDYEFFFRVAGLGFRVHGSTPNSGSLVLSTVAMAISYNFTCTITYGLTSKQPQALKPQPFDLY